MQKVSNSKDVRLRNLDYEAILLNHPNSSPLKDQCRLKSRSSLVLFSKTFTINLFLKASCLFIFL